MQEHRRERQVVELFRAAEHPLRRLTIHLAHRAVYPFQDARPWADGRPAWAQCAWDAWDGARRDGTADVHRELKAHQLRQVLRPAPYIVRDGDAGRLAGPVPAAQYDFPLPKAAAEHVAEAEAERCKPAAVPSAARSCGVAAELAGLPAEDAMSPSSCAL